MVKQRLTSGDIAAEVACLRERIVGLRIANVYDINPKTYALKLARSGEDGDKVFLLIQSGARFHTVEALPPKPDTPSNFTLKLRKHLRTRRVEAVRQLGVDRVVSLSVGSGPTACHLVLEFFAQGNIVLTDAEYTILTLLRSHRDDSAGLAVMANHPYPLGALRSRRGAEAPAARLEAMLLQQADRGRIVENASQGNRAEDMEEERHAPRLATRGEGVDQDDQQEQEGGDSAAATDTTQPSSLEAALASVLPYGPSIAEHVARSAGLEPKGTLEAARAPEAIAALVAAVQEYERWLAGLQTGPTGGRILLGPDGESFESFEPRLLEQHKGRPCLEFASFDDALRTFFDRVGGQRADTVRVAKQKTAVGKVEAVRRDAEQRVNALTAEAESNEHLARCVEANAELVDAALGSVREALAGGVAWNTLEKLIREEAAAGNPVAAAVAGLDLAKNRVTLRLLEEPGSPGISRRPLQVSLDLALSAHANARLYYDARRKHNAKKERTLAASDLALAAAEKKAAQQMKRLDSVPTPAIARKAYWFERFHWFISSENYLVLSGRDAQQNELLVKRYMKKGDVYCHADLHGASTTVVKNHTPDHPISPLTLAEAGAACVARSSAWGSKIVTSAWWVHPEQVSKTAPTGEYLTTGSFMIRGKKNYLPPQPLVVGLGLLFRLEDSCIVHHLGERAVRSQLGGEGEGVNGAGIRGTTSLQAKASAAVSSSNDGAEGDTPAVGKEAQETEGSGPCVDSALASNALAAFLDSGLESLPRMASGGGVSAHARQYDRYGLLPSGAGEAADEEPGADAAEAMQQQRVRHMSAKQRQVLKSGGNSRTPASSAGPSQIAKEELTSRRKDPTPPPPQRPKRGSKNNKKAGRYVDEEDAALARAALQSEGAAKSRRQRKEEHKARLAAKKVAANAAVVRPVGEEDIARAIGEQFEGLAVEEGESGNESGLASSSDADEPEGGAGAMSIAEESAAPGLAASLAEEDSQLLEEEDRERLTQVDALTGQPRADDTLLFAMPVVAPYQALTNYKYKVKMVPGTQKKGKAYRQALEMFFQKVAEGTERERMLARAIPEPEAVTAFVGTVKIQAPGMLKAKQAMKKKK